jgi:hypothetical protein
VRRALLGLALAAACGGSSATDPGGSNPQTGGNRKTLTVTYNGATFAPTSMSAVYSAGAVAIFATDGRRGLQITSANVQTAGTYSFAVGAASGLVFLWTDNGSFSSGFATNPGTITFTTLQTGRVAGTFNVVVRDGTAASSQTVTLNGTFDITSP